LIHGNHMASIVNTKELEILICLKLTSGLSADEPFLILSIVKL